VLGPCWRVEQWPSRLYISAFLPDLGLGINRPRRQFVVVKPANPFGAERGITFCGHRHDRGLFCSPSPFARNLTLLGARYAYGRVGWVSRETRTCASGFLWLFSGDQGAGREQPPRIGRAATIQRSSLRGVLKWPPIRQYSWRISPTPGSTLVRTHGLYRLRANVGVGRGSLFRTLWVLRHRASRPVRPRVLVFSAEKWFSVAHRNELTEENITVAAIGSEVLGNFSRKRIPGDTGVHTPDFARHLSPRGVDRALALNPSCIQKF